MLAFSVLLAFSVSFVCHVRLTPTLSHLSTCANTHMQYIHPHTLFQWTSGFVISHRDPIKQIQNVTLILGIELRTDFYHSEKPNLSFPIQREHCNAYALHAKSIRNVWDLSERYCCWIVFHQYISTSTVLCAGYSNLSFQIIRRVYVQFKGQETIYHFRESGN